MAKIKPSELWKRCTDLVLERSDRFGPLNEAMRAAVVVAVEGDRLIVGLSGPEQYLAGHLETASNRHEVCACLKELTGRELDYEVIEGTAKEDWEQQREARESRGLRGTVSAAPAASATLEVDAAAPAAARGGMTGPWEEVMERLHYAYQQVQARTHPMVRAQFLMDALPILAEAESKAAQQGEPEERIQRSLTRSLERVAMLADVSPTQVALELLRYRGQPAPKAKPARKRK